MAIFLKKKQKKPEFFFHSGLVFLFFIENFNVSLIFH